MYRHGRHFTVEEANGLLGRLTIMLVKLQDALRLLDSQRQQAVEYLKLSRGNGKHHDAPEIDGLELVQQTVGDIESYGCVVKGFDDPLIDFPHLREGEEVYLCWRLGEPEVQAWHPLDEGFASRRPL